MLKGLYISLECKYFTKLLLDKDAVVIYDKGEFKGIYNKRTKRKYFPKVKIKLTDNAMILRNSLMF